MNISAGKISIFLCFCLGMVYPAGAQTETLKRFGVESGIVEYKIHGSEKGTEVIYFDQWGLREARYTTIENPLLGLRHILTIIDKEWIYRIDLDKKIGNKKSDPVLKKLLEAPPQDGVPLAVHVLVNSGAKKLGVEEIGEKRTDFWEIKALGKRVWLWEGLPVKIYTEQGTVKITQTSTAILEGVIPEDKFVIPPDIQFIERDIDEVLLSYKKQGNEQTWK